MVDTKKRFIVASASNYISYDSHFRSLSRNYFKLAMWLTDAKLQFIIDYDSSMRHNSSVKSRNARDREEMSYKVAEWNFIPQLLSFTV